MDFWSLWFKGWVIVLVTRIAINMFCREPYDKYGNNKIVRAIINLLIITSIVIVGGIPIGVVFCCCALVCMSKISVLLILIIGILGIFLAFIIYLAGYLVLGLYHLDKYRNLQKLFRVVFMLSIIGWSILIYQDYRNTEISTQTIINSKEERQLLFFYNIPIQDISGTISGSSFLGTGSVSGEISTTDNLPYWYLNQNGEGIFDSVSSADSKIVFIDNNKSPYLEIVVYSTQTISKNNKTGVETTRVDKTWTEYTFYLPSEIIQNNLS